METLDITTLSQRTGIDANLLTRVRDRSLVDDRSWLIAPDSTPVNAMDVIAACLVAVAAKLLQAGCTEEATKVLLKWACLVPGGGKRRSLNLPAIARGLTKPIAAVIQLADGSYVRVRAGQQTTEWYDVSGTHGVASEGFEPTVLVAVDVARIRDAVMSP